MAAIAGEELGKKEAVQELGDWILSSFGGFGNLICGEGGEAREGKQRWTMELVKSLHGRSGRSLVVRGDSLYRDVRE